MSDNQTLGNIVSKHLPDLKHFEEVYRQIHQNPELSGQEAETARYPSRHLRELGFEGFENVGGHRVAGLLRNKPGKTVLMRADMDALPIFEKTGLPYASTKRAIWTDGVEYPVMHACGHDMNTAVLMATASLLPAEEALYGAETMVKDDLYEKIPMPDLLLGQHVERTKAGTVSVRSGPVLAGVDSYHVKIHGIGGHSAKPNSGINPINIGARIVARLPEILTTKISPNEFGVISVGTIHAGQAQNIIPDTLEMKLTVRNYDDRIRDILHNEIIRVVTAECEAVDTPHKPEIIRIDSGPPTINNPEIVNQVFRSFKEHFGEDAFEAPRDTASEDFANLAKPYNIPYAYWYFGSTPAAKWNDAARQGKIDLLIPEGHSPLFAPAIQPTMKSGTEAFAIAALTFLAPSNNVFLTQQSKL